MPAEQAPATRARAKGPPRLAPGALAATIASGAMIAQQVAGRAARDAMYLSSFNVKTLPWMMAASAVLSLVGVFWLSRMMTRHSPAKVVPIGFAVSGGAFLAEWGLSFPLARLAAVAVYLHISLFGAAAISAFWSLINETFDPHAGKKAASLIAGGGTLGGVLGGLAAWRASSFIAVPTMLPLMASVSVLCLWGTLRLRAQHPALSTTTEIAGVADAESASPLRLLRDSPYLRNLALVVALGAVTSGLIDYVFSAEAARAFTRGPSLLSFFALFWLVVGVVSFALQMLLGRIALEKLGLAVTVALLPAVVVLGGAVGLAVPGLWSTALVRGAEASQRNSLFRAAYELLYTPLSEQRKRATKSLIDVGFDRLGTLTASGIALLTLFVMPARANLVLLAAGILCAIATLTRSRPLHLGYAAALEESMHRKAAQVEPAAARERATALEKNEVHDKIADKLEELPRSAELAAIVSGEAVLAPVPAKAEAHAENDARKSAAASLAATEDLLSGDPARVRRVLLGEATLARHLVPLAILLLGDKDLHLDVSRALRLCAAKNTGQLLDALSDPDVALDVRRRIPPVLAQCRTQHAAEGLIRGAADDRFEVRYECGRALLKITDEGSPVVITAETVIAIVKREVALSEDVWKSQATADLDSEEDEAPALIDRLLRYRIDRSLEHVFTILALHLDRESIRVAFKALHQEDERLRGTALEYLETVLPDEIRDAVWPFLGEQRPMRARRPADEVLADLTRVKGAPALA
jgi:AAA family ATP:ADP antiporter